jgi:hypothetical protein
LALPAKAARKAGKHAQQQPTRVLDCWGARVNALQCVARNQQAQQQPFCNGWQQFCHATLPACTNKGGMAGEVSAFHVKENICRPTDIAE